MTNLSFTIRSVSTIDDIIKAHETSQHTVVIFSACKTVDESAVKEYYHGCRDYLKIYPQLSMCLTIRKIKGWLRNVKRFHDSAHQTIITVCGCTFTERKQRICKEIRRVKVSH